MQIFDVNLFLSWFEWDEEDCLVLSSAAPESILYPWKSTFVPKELKDMSLVGLVVDSVRCEKVNENSKTKFHVSNNSKI